MNEHFNILAQLKSWLRGEVRQADEARLEQHALTDDFLKDALEGFRSHPEHDHLEVTERLRRKLHQQSNFRRNIVPIWVRYAASVAFLLTLTGLLYWLNRNPDSPLAEESSPDFREESIASPREEAPEVFREPEGEDHSTVTVPKNPKQTNDYPEATPPQAQNAEADKSIALQQDEPQSTEKESIQALDDQEEMAGTPEVISPPPVAFPQQSVPTLHKDSNRIITFVDPQGQPVSGVRLQIKDGQTPIAISDQLGQIRTHFLDTPMQVERTGYQPISIPIRSDSAALYVLQPTTYAQPSRAKRWIAKEAEPFPTAYPSVGMDSLMQYVQKRIAYPRRLLILSFTVDAEGNLSNPSPRDDLSTALFEILKEGPVWVIPPSQDSVRATFRY